MSDSYNSAGSQPHSNSGNDDHRASLEQTEKKTQEMDEKSIQAAYGGSQDMIVLMEDQASSAEGQEMSVASSTSTKSALVQVRPSNVLANIEPVPSCSKSSATISLPKLAPITEIAEERAYLQPASVSINLFDYDDWGEPVDPFVEKIYIDTKEKIKISEEQADLLKKISNSAELVNLPEEPQDVTTASSEFQFSAVLNPSSDSLEIEYPEWYDEFLSMINSKAKEDNSGELFQTQSIFSKDYLGIAGQSQASAQVDESFHEATLQAMAQVEPAPEISCDTILRPSDAPLNRESVELDEFLTTMLAEPACAITNTIQEEIKNILSAQSTEISDSLDQSKQSLDENSDLPIKETATSIPKPSSVIDTATDSIHMQADETIQDVSTSKKSIQQPKKRPRSKKQKVKGATEIKKAKKKWEFSSPPPRSPPEASGLMDFLKNSTRAWKRIKPSHMCPPHPPLEATNTESYNTFKLLRGESSHQVTHSTLELDSAPLPVSTDHGLRRSDATRVSLIRISSPTKPGESKKESKEKFAPSKIIISYKTTPSNDSSNGKSEHDEGTLQTQACVEPESAPLPVSTDHDQKRSGAQQDKTTDATKSSVISILDQTKPGESIRKADKREKAATRKLIISYKTSPSKDSGNGKSEHDDGDPSSSDKT